MPGRIPRTTMKGCSESRGARPMSETPKRADQREVRLLLLAALGILLACLLLNRVVLGNVPHGWDGAAYHFQGQIFASGRVVAPSTEFNEFFWLANVIHESDRRYAKYPPGWALLLAPAIACGAPELANAVMAALCAVLIWVAAARLYDRRTAWTAVGLAATSPFFMFMGASHLSHMSCAVALTALLLTVTRSLETIGNRSVLWGVSAGAAAGAAGLIRPFSAALGIVGTVLIVALWLRPCPTRWLRLGLAALPPLLVALGLFLAYNRLTTGDPFLLGYRRYNPDHTLLGESGFHRANVWENLAVNLPKCARGLNTQVWGWPLPDLSLILALAVVGLRDRRTWALVGATVLFAFGHSLYYFFDFYYGPRMIFETMPWIVIASAAGLTSLWDWAARVSRPRWILRLVVLTVAVNLAVGVGIFFPKMAVYYSANYCGQGKDLIRIVDEAGLDNAIVFLRTSENFAFANVSHRNTVDLHGSPVLFARYHEERMEQMMAAFPRREHWILDLEYEGRLGLNDYHDRFEITRARWIRLVPG